MLMADPHQLTADDKAQFTAILVECPDAVRCRDTSLRSPGLL